MTREDTVTREDKELHADEAVLEALKRDTGSIRSPQSLDQKILAQARSAANARRHQQQAQKSKASFRFWHYCAAASAAGFLVLATTFFSREPEMIEAATPRLFTGAVQQQRQQSPPETQLTESMAPDSEQATPAAALSDNSRSETGVFADQVPARPEASGFTSGRKEKSVTERLRKQELAKSSSAKSIESARTDGRETARAAAHRSPPAQLRVVDCRTLSVADALKAQRRFVQTQYIQRRAAATNAESSPEKVELWRQQALQQIAREQQQLDQAMAKNQQIPPQWGENWWRAEGWLDDGGRADGERADWERETTAEPQLTSAIELQCLVGAGVYP